MLRPHLVAVAEACTTRVCTLNNKNKVFVMDGSHSWFGYGVIRGVIFHVLGTNALASNALYRYRNAVLRNCNALFDFQMTLFYVLDNLVFAVRALLAKIVALFAKIIR